MAHSGIREWRIEVDAETSERLSNVRQANTQPEQVLRRLLWRAGYRFTLRNGDLPGRPDLANRTRGWAVFVHGCFWHRHDCPRATTPKRNRAFWLEKFAANKARDARNLASLRRDGFRVEVVWECELAEPDRVLKRLKRSLPPST